MRNFLINLTKDTVKEIKGKFCSDEFEFVGRYGNLVYWKI